MEEIMTTPDFIIAFLGICAVAICGIMLIWVLYLFNKEVIDDKKCLKGDRK